MSADGSQVVWGLAISIFLWLEWTFFFFKKKKRYATETYVTARTWTTTKKNVNVYDYFVLQIVIIKVTLK